MEQPQPFCERQRAAFARLIEEGKKRETAELESESDVDHRVRSEVLPKLAKEYGASASIAKVRKSRKKLHEAEKALGKLGFSCDEDRISLKWDAPRHLQVALAEATRAALKERQQALTKYDRAILDVWAAEDAQEAKRVVEKLL